MTTATEPALFLKLLRQAEPVAVLASLSLVIAVFTFDHKDTFQVVYNYAIVSTFMFIFAFVAAVARNLRSVKTDRVYSGASSFSFYFFLGIGLIHLLLIAIEFGKQQSQIFAFVYGWVYSLFGGMAALGATKTLLNLKNASGTKRAVLSIHFGCMFMVAVGGLGLATVQLTFAFSGNAITLNQTPFAFAFIAGFAALGLLKFIEDVVKITRRQIVSDKNQARGALRWAG